MRTQDARLQWDRIRRKARDRGISVYDEVRHDPRSGRFMSGSGSGGGGKAGPAGSGGGGGHPGDTPKVRKIVATLKRRQNEDYKEYSPIDFHKRYGLSEHEARHAYVEAGKHFGYNRRHDAPWS